MTFGTSDGLQGGIESEYRWTDVWEDEMAVKHWEQIQTIFCERAQAEASLEVEVVYATDTLPDLPPRVLAHRCSRSLECIFCGPAQCHWTGENPGRDPFGVMG